MLIAMAVYDTAENGRLQATSRTFASLYRTVGWDKHRLIVSDNGSYDETQRLYKDWHGRFPFDVIRNGENLGTANAINRAWAHAGPGETCVKMDNDVVVAQYGWADLVQEALDRKSDLGILGLKRKELEERPDHQVPAFRSWLEMLPHQRGQRWIVVEHCRHIMGTCQAYSAALRDKIGYLYQMGSLYAFDDCLASVRAHLAGFKTAFLHGVDIEHIECGTPDYREWKRRIAAEYERRCTLAVRQYQAGEVPVYYDGGERLAEYTEGRDVSRT